MQRGVIRAAQAATESHDEKNRGTRNRDQQPHGAIIYETRLLLRTHEDSTTRSQCGRMLEPCIWWSGEGRVRVSAVRRDDRFVRLDSDGVHWASSARARPAELSGGSLCRG